MKQPGVCMVTTYFCPWAGGAEKQIERLSTWLAAHGAPVMVVTRRFDDLPTREAIHGVEVFRVPVLPGKALGMLSFIVMGLGVMLRHRRRFDVIHSHQIFSPTTLGWLAARLLRRPLIVNLHGGGPTGDVGRLTRRRLTGRLRLAALRRGAAAFVAISAEIADELRAQGVPAAKIHFLGNGIDPDQFGPVDAEARRALRCELGLPVDAPLATFVGRLVEGKGLDVLLDAWAHTPPPAHLVIVGAGPLAEMLAARAAAMPGRVTLAGQRDNVAQYLQASDVWTLPSFGEGLPVSLLEAMACALPVVVTSVGAMPQVVAHGDNGLVVPPGDAAALAAALRAALDGSEAARAMGQRARQTVLDRYSIDRVAQSYLDLYTATVTGARRSG